MQMTVTPSFSFLLDCEQALFAAFIFCKWYLTTAADCFDILDIRRVATFLSSAFSCHRLSCSHCVNPVYDGSVTMCATNMRRYLQALLMVVMIERLKFVAVIVEKVRCLSLSDICLA